MFGEQIKKFFQSKEGIDLKKSFDLITLPLISQFRYFQFSGLADDTNLTKNFSDVDLAGRYLVLKSIKIVPYSQVAMQDLFLSDGVTTNEETIPTNARINRLFDVYDYGVQLSIIVNGSKIPVFPSEVLIVPPAADGNVPFDLDVDNIFYKFPEKINTFDIRVDGQVFTNLEVPAVAQPAVKVFVQCYIF